jgi:hypothetical protein
MKFCTVGALFLLITALAHGQNPSSWPCSDDLTKSEGDNHRIRISIGISEALAQKKILPDVSDLKEMKVDSTVTLKVLIGKDGVVRCADPVQGDQNLFPRSVDAAKQWRFQPYLLNGQPIIVETPIEFVFKKNKVTAR